MKKVLDIMYAKRGDKMHVAVRSIARDTIVATGAFPHNCPRQAIAEWLKKIEEREVALQTIDFSTLAVA